jgi:hypothetical protein
LVFCEYLLIARVDTMKHSFTLARFHFTIEFTAEMLGWLKENFPGDWLEVKDGKYWAEKYWKDWQGVLEAIVLERVERYFKQIEVPENRLPEVDQVESYGGPGRASAEGAAEVMLDGNLIQVDQDQSYGHPWHVDARVVMEGSNSQVRTILQWVSKSVDEIIRDLPDLRDDILKEAVPRLGDAIEKTLRDEIELLRPEDGKKWRSKEPRKPTPDVVVAVDLVINSRPIAALRTLEPRTGEVHLKVRISRSKLWVANLWETPMEDVQIGVFRGEFPLVQFVYGDSYMGYVDKVRPQEIVVMKMADLENARGEKLDFSDGERAHVGCWVKDGRGIFLFEFVLEEEGRVT